jgi:hypothetical protein
MRDRFHTFFLELNLDWLPATGYRLLAVLTDSKRRAIRGAYHRLTRSYTSFASSVICVFPLNSFEIGQPFFALFAAVSKLAALAPGTFARVVR